MNNDMEDLGSLFQLLAGQKKQYDPRMQYSQDILKSDTKDSYGVLAKGLAGFNFGRSTNDYEQTVNSAQQAQNAIRSKALSILQEHENRGLGEDVTFKALSQLAAETGDKFVLDLAKEFKPAAKNQSEDPISQKKNYISATYPDASSGLMTSSEKEKMSNDPNVLYLNEQIRSFLGVPASPTESVMSTGESQDSYQESPTNYRDLLKAAAFGPMAMAAKLGSKKKESTTQAPLQERYLSEDELARQNNINLSRRKDVEAIIEANMKAYNRPRQEVMAALRRKGII